MLLNNQQGEGLGKARLQLEFEMHWKVLCRGAGWLLQAGGKGVDGVWSLHMNRGIGKRPGRECVSTSVTEKRFATANVNPDDGSSDENFSCLSLIHDQYFRLPLHQQCLKTSSCSKENHFYSRHTQRRLDLTQPGAGAADGDGSLHPRAAGLLWHFPQLLLAKMISFYKCKTPHMAVLMTSVSQD